MMPYVSCHVNILLVHLLTGQILIKNGPVISYVFMCLYESKFRSEAAQGKKDLTLGCITLATDQLRSSVLAACLFVACLK